MSKSDAHKRFPSFFQALGDVEKKIKGGCSVAVALIHRSRLFVANVGDTRALLCRVDPNNEELGVIQVITFFCNLIMMMRLKPSKPKTYQLLFCSAERTSHKFNNDNVIIFQPIRLFFQKSIFISNFSC